MGRLSRRSARPNALLRQIRIDEKKRRKANDREDRKIEPKAGDINVKPTRRCEQRRRYWRSRKMST